MARLRGSGRTQLRTARATSAGGIVIRSGTGRQVLLGMRLHERDRVTWTLPKGTPIAGESVEQTAVREVGEETGLQVRILEPVGDVEYWFIQDGTRIHKTVHYFLMAATGGDLAAHDHEFADVRWVDLEEAERLMSHVTEREIVARAMPAVDRRWPAASAGPPRGGSAGGPPSGSRV